MSKAYAIEQDFTNVATSTGAGLSVRASLVDGSDNQIYTPVLTVHIEASDNRGSLDSKIGEAVQAFADSQTFVLDEIILLPEFRKIG